MTQRRRPDDDGRGETPDDLHQSPAPINEEDFRYMIRTTYKDVRELKRTLNSLVEVRSNDNVRIDRLEQAHKERTFWNRLIASTAVAGLGTALWSLITSGNSHQTPH